MITDEGQVSCMEFNIYSLSTRAKDLGTKGHLLEKSISWSII